MDMEIRFAKKIELITKDGNIEVEPQFRVTFEDKRSMMVPANPENRHYLEIKEWFDEQSKKPFKFKFEDLE